MQQTFYRVWLPISIITHIGLLFLLGLVKLPKLVHFDKPFPPLSAEPIAQAALPILPEPPVEPAPSPVHIRLGVSNPKTPDGNDPQDGVILKPGPGGTSTAPGNGIGHTKAPRVLTSNYGDETTSSNTSPYGTGTGGNDLGGEDGTSRGRAALGSPYGGPLKKELSDLNIRRFVVEATVTLTETGTVDRVRVRNSYGDDVNAVAIGKLEDGARYYIMLHPEKFTGVGDTAVRVVFEGGRYHIEK